MTTTLTATHRIFTQWINDGIIHDSIAYCERGTDIAGIPYLKDRDGVTELPWTDAIAQLRVALQSVVGNTFAGLSHQLEERSGSLWFPVAFGTTLALSGGPAQPASQFTLVLRDTSFLKIRVTLLECIHGYVGHSNTGLGINGAIDDFVGNYNGDGGGSDMPYRWQKSRGNNFILGVGSVAGGTLDLNDKMKRRRGLE